MGWVEEKNGFGKAMGWHQRIASLASNADMTVGIIGLGYVGLPTAIGFHDAGFTVWGVDVSQRTVDAVKAGKNPTGDQIKLCVALGMLMLIGQFCFLEALKRAELSFVAPFFYNTLIFVIIFDYIIYNLL